MQGQQQLPALALSLQANSTIIPISDECIEDFMKDVKVLTEAEMQKAPKDIQPAVYFLPGGRAKTFMPSASAVCSQLPPSGCPDVQEHSRSQDICRWGQ